MEQGLDLKAFLDSQVQEGVVDSRGAFTVAREKALKKLASYALPGDYDWVLKVVQAVNVWAAPRLVVQQSRVATSFFFCPPAGAIFPSESAIVEALESVALDGENPVHQLAMALRSLVEQCELSFVLAVRQHGAVSKPIFAGADVSGLDSKTREQWTQLEWEGVRLTVSHFKPGESLTGRYVPTFSRQTRRDVEILRQLESLCFASPAPIEVDRRPVARVFPRGDFFQTHYLRPWLLGTLSDSGQGRAVRTWDPVPIRIPRNHLFVSSSLEQRDRPWFLVTGFDWKIYTSGYVTMVRTLGPLNWRFVPNMHHLYWVRHGVVVEGYRIPGSAATLTLFLPAERLRSDLSGLQVSWSRPCRQRSRRSHLSSRRGWRSQQTCGRCG